MTDLNSSERARRRVELERRRRRGTWKIPRYHPFWAGLGFSAMFLLGFPKRGGNLEPTLHGIARIAAAVVGAALLTLTLRWYIRRGMARGGQRPRRLGPGWKPPR